MKLIIVLIVFLTGACSSQVFAQQADSVKANIHYTHRDSLNLAKMNTYSNLMIAGGIGLCGAGTYLIVEGAIIYHSATSPTGPTLSQNHSQGAGYIAGGVAGIAAGVVLGAFGIKQKLEFKKRLQKMSLQTGLLDNGNLGTALNF